MKPPNNDISLAENTTFVSFWRDFSVIYGVFTFVLDRVVSLLEQSEVDEVFGGFLSRFFSKQPIEFDWDVV